MEDLVSQVTLRAQRDRRFKNPQARSHQPACFAKPQTYGQIQATVRWALKHRHSLTVVGGGHSEHGVWPDVVAIDMTSFTRIDVFSADEANKTCVGNPGPLVVVETGCRTDDIVRRTQSAGLVVPLGTCPSVGAGSWLQGGFGHLTRAYGLTSDAIVGAVLVDVKCGRLLCVGTVPRPNWPLHAHQPNDGADLLWALKGAGTNFGVIISLTFRASPAATFSSLTWALSLPAVPFGPSGDNGRLEGLLASFEKLSFTVHPRNFAAECFLYFYNGGLRMGWATFDSYFDDATPSSTTTAAATDTHLPANESPGTQAEEQEPNVTGLEIFQAEKAIRLLHYSMCGNKTSSFKRCVFLRHVKPGLAGILLSAMNSSPSAFCRIHLHHYGSEAIQGVAVDATAFGCRDLAFACVVHGMWPRSRDGTETARAAVQWVYDTVAKILSLPLAAGVYGADLGPDPRDFELASKAFGPNLARLQRLKRRWDPSNVLGYACPIFKTHRAAKLIVVVTGESGVGKDYCAKILAETINTSSAASQKACVVSISDATKDEYAAETGADLDRLLSDRQYKEQHRSALTAFYRQQVRQRPQLPMDNFQHVVRIAEDADVLFITGVRDTAPVANFSSLVPGSRLLEVRVHASENTQKTRRALIAANDDVAEDDERQVQGDDVPRGVDLDSSAHPPTFVLDNDMTGEQAAKEFAERNLVRFLHNDLQKLADMARLVHDFPYIGIDFRHVLGIVEQPGGLSLCTSLLKTHYTGQWADVGAVVCCEAGGFIFASALASSLALPLALVRNEGKLPPPTVSTEKPASHVSESASGRIEMRRDAIAKDGSVVIVDDVLATGRTLCAVLRLLQEAGVRAERVSVMVVAEFPVHGGRRRLLDEGFGAARVQSLLVFGGA